MVAVIASKTKEIMFNCCKRYATSNKSQLENTQLILSLNVVKNEDEFALVSEKELNKYTICENYKPKKELTIWEVLNVRPFLDFLGYSQMAPPFVFKALTRFAEKYEIPLDKVCVLCQPDYTENKRPDMKLALYNGFEFIKEIKFYPKEDEEETDTDTEYLFNDEDIEIPKE